LSGSIFAIYTDGSGGYGLYGGRGVCGYAAIVARAVDLNPDDILILGGAEAESTHQRAELLAMITALEYLQQDVSGNTDNHSIPVFSDSKYLVDAMNEQWITKWEHNGWLNTKGKPIDDRDLWLRIATLQKILKTQITVHHIMGHSDALGRKGRLAQLKNRDRFGPQAEHHNQGNQMANIAAGKFRRHEI
jgi:ribonuclease HI